MLKDHQLGDVLERERVTEVYASCGIDPERLILLPGSAKAEHLAAYARVDVALDPAPQTGGVSTLEALWMGVPVVTLLGNNLSSRASASILSVLGLQDWIASNEDEYVEIAARLVHDVPARARMREALRSIVRNSVIADGARYCRAVEAAYRQMWTTYCSAAEVEVR